MKKINVFLILTGIFLILDGILSIVAQFDEDLMYHLPRITRGVIGLYILLVGVWEIDVEIGVKDSNSKLALNYRIGLVLIGSIIIVDALISIIVQFDEPLYMNIGRYVRGGIGISYVVVGLLIFRNKAFFPFKKK